MTQTRHFNDSFLARFHRARSAEVAVALHCLAKGNTVKLPKRSLKGSDAGDMFVNGQRVEVKHLQHDFELGLWPWHSVTICSKSWFDDTEQKPSWFWIVNKAITTAVLVDVKTTQGDWFVRSQVDPERQIIYDVYAVDPDFVGWRLLEWEDFFTCEL